MIRSLILQLRKLCRCAWHRPVIVYVIETSLRNGAQVHARLLVVAAEVVGGRRAPYHVWQHATVTAR